MTRVIIANDADSAAYDILQFLIAQPRGLLRLIPEPIRLDHIEPSFLHQRHCSIGSPAE